MEENRRGRIALLGLGAALLVLVFVSFLLGRYPVPPGMLLRILLHKLLAGLGSLLSPLVPGAAGWGLGQSWDGSMEAVAWNIRLPRILLSCLVGCCLSVAGASYQGVFQNPMASPDILGATNGAAFGASLAILLGAASQMITLSAFCFSILTVAAAFFVSRLAGGKRVLTLVLAGIMVGSLFSAGTSFVKLVADPSNQLPEITYWLMGSLSGAKWKQVGLAVIPMAAGLLPLLLLRWRVNVLTLGDDEARTMGVNAGRIRLIVILCATLITAASVAVSGMIGWVGLVIPHLSRKLVGNDYRRLTPASMLFGAAFMLAVDDVSRNLLTVEIPIGILTAFVGAPFFIWLITRKGDAF
ncbi:MAG: iron ABC transporter permease [Oscillospiraceae bacterium]|nr:iron ABC transporter permease [Oscillospiraceae bacterium]